MPEFSKRRVSYVLPSPSRSPPWLDLPPFGASPDPAGSAGPVRSSPLLVPKPTLGSRNPFATPEPEAEAAPTHPRHRLGVSALALDTSTLLHGEAAPGGILYTGGRDGLVASWELHVPHTRRRGRRYRVVPGRGTGARVRWERAGDGATWEEDEEEGEGEGGGASASLGSSSSDDEEHPERRSAVPFEDRWELDRSVKTAPPATTFRESVQTHTDWVNDLVLCNMNQTVITASSDRTIRAWSPHAAEDELAVPALIGQHTDYVRSLAFARTAGVLFSGALDRDISVWDIAGPRPNDPVLKVRLGDMDDNSGIGLEGEWGSIYALGVDPLGHTLAAGTPERVVRLWDPRAGDRSVTKLVGHTECVRSILLSDDGRYMLTGSSDTTIKLWSVGEHRCLHTFNHHTSSVWALHSNHPNLERFYSGSRDGHLCVVDVEQVGDLSEGECVVLAREGEAGAKGEQESKTGDEAIRSITSMDDEYVWTATASSNVHRWRDVGRRVYRMELDGASYPEPTSTVEEARPLVNVGSVIDRPTSIIDKPRTKALAVDDNELARTESRESRTITFAPDPKVESSPVSAMSALSLAPPSPSSAGAAASGVPASVRERLNNGSRRAASISSMLSVRSEMSVAEQEWGLHGLPYESLVCLGLPDAPYSLGFSGAAHSTASLASAMRARSVEDSPEQAVSERALNPRSAARRAFEDRDVASEAVPFRAEPDAVITGSPGLIRSLVLNDRLHVLTLDTTGEVAVWHLLKGTCLGRFAPKDIAEALELERGVADARLELKLHPHEVLELVQHRIEGKNSVLPWCQVDTKVGHITVHLEGDRVFAADVIPDELGVELVADTEGRPLNIGKVVLGNLFQGLIKAEEMELQSVISSSPTTVASSLPSISRSPVPPSLLAVDLASPHPRHRQRALSSTSLTLTGSGGGTPTPSINITGLATRAERAAIRPDAPFGQSAPASSSGWLSAASGGAVTPLRSGAFAALGGSAATPTSTTSDIPARDYFSLRKEPTSASASAAGTAAASPAEKKEALPLPQSPGPASNGSSSSGGGLLSKKFKAFGKKKQAEPQMTTVVESKLEERVEAKGPELQLSERDKSQLLFLDGLRARTFAPPPPVEVPPVALPPATAVIISEQSQADGAYFVTYRSQVSSTERDMEPLEMNSPFWLLDFLFTDSTPEERRVPKIPLILLPAGESVGSGKGLKVQASRTARVRGVLEHLAMTRTREEGGRDRSVSDASTMSGIPDLRRRAPEETMELLCGDRVADPDMKVATLKAYYWRGGVDMVLYWRAKTVNA